MAGNLTRVRSRLAVAGALLITTAAFGLATTFSVEAATPKSKVVAGPRVRAGEDVFLNEDSKATCPSGTRLIGGGYNLFVGVSGPDNIPLGLVVANAPSVSKQNTWVAGAEGDAEIQAFALCETAS
jgi:hypothetical protein